MSKSAGNKIGNVIRDAVLILFSASFLLPLYWMLILSVKDKIQAASAPFAIPSGLHFENFAAAWERIKIPQLLTNSFIYTAGSVALCILLSVMVAYAITRMQMRHEAGARLYFTMGMVIPVGVMLIPVYRIILGLGLKGTYWALILPYAAFSMSSCILIVCAFFRSIPMEMEEAAAIDGANVYTTFFRIMVPMVKPAVATEVMILFINNWNEYALASVLAMGRNMRTIPVALDLFFGTFDVTHWGVVGAAVTVTSLPVILIFMFCNRQIEAAMLGTSGLK